MQANQKNVGSKILLAVVSVVAAAALILGIVALVDHDNTKKDTIPSINQQVDNIKDTLPKLEAVSTELRGYIETLEATAKKLQSDLDDTNTAIDTLETEVYGKVDAEKAAILDQLKADKAELEGKLADAIKDHDADVANLQKQINTVNANITALKAELEGKIADSEQKVLNELNALKADIEGQIAAINNNIVTLQAKDTELDQKIEDLKTYVDGKITETREWANATFSTLEQYEGTQTAISEINALIKSTQESITALEEKLSKKIADDIATAVAGVNADIAAKVKEITDGYTAAIADATNAITAAYTDAIKTAITDSENSMKEWVNGVLADGYYQKAEMDGKITALQTQVAEGDAALQEEINDLKAALEQAKKALTDAYKEAIEDAINENNGVIRGEIAAAVKTAQDILQADINSIHARIDDIASRLADVESQIKELLNQIQSVTFMPQYSDGKVLLDYARKQTSLDFMINPQSLNTALVEAWENSKDTENSIIKVYVRYTNDPVMRPSTGSVAAPIELTVETVTASDGGILSITVKDNNPSPLSEDFWLGKQEAVIYIVISDGVTEISSEAIPMVAHNYAANTNTISGFDDGGTYSGEAG